MKIDLKEFIEKYKNEINNRLFEKIYSLTTAGELGQSDIGKLTELFYTCGIDPLEYLKNVPYCYAYGSALKDIKIPDRIISIGKRAFAFCADLTNVVIPDSVNSIYYQAFYSCTELTSIIIPDSVTSISNEVFYNCSRLTSVTIGNSVTSIGENAFWECYSLKTIDYAGNKEQWRSISKGTNWGGGTFIKVVHCIDGDIKYDIL